MTDVDLIDVDNVDTGLEVEVEVFEGIEVTPDDVLLTIAVGGAIDDVEVETIKDDVFDDTEVKLGDVMAAGSELVEVRLLIGA